MLPLVTSVTSRALALDPPSNPHAVRAPDAVITSVDRAPRREVGIAAGESCALVGLAAKLLIEAGFTKDLWVRVENASISERAIKPAIKPGKRTILGPVA